MLHKVGAEKSISVAPHVAIGALGDTSFNIIGTLLWFLEVVILVDLIRETDAPVSIRNFKVPSLELEFFDWKST